MNNSSENTVNNTSRDYRNAVMSHSEKMRAWWKLYEDAAAIEKKLIASGRLAGANVRA